MNFLAPLFLAGAAAIALPIFFHLIRRTTRDRFRFSSLRFLRPSPPRMDRRSRLENLLLLILRCAALVLLAAGFARPFLRGEATPAAPETQARRMLVLVDTSASMRRPGLWDDARAKAGEVLRRTQPGDEVAVVTFDRATETRFGFDEWSRTPAGERAALATARLKDVEPGWSATHLGEALIAAADALQDRNDTHFSGKKEIVLI
ncbi:MAG: BatA domain-containing protein, partial [Verrucomicrobiales bacterium]|nr:BatA domain-containing protein [Verrucomicrobiales bacterium]